MVRNWLTRCLMLLVAALFSAQAFALGLGDITVHSALNERFSADIEILDSSGLSPEEIVVSLASSDDFERVGVERFFFLTNLKFEVVAADAGGAVIRVTSAKAITEPYLNFLVEALWPAGRLLKEYTVLLDPPTFADAPAPAVRAPTRSAEAPPAPARISGQSPVDRRSGTRRPGSRIAQRRARCRPGNASIR